MLVLPGVHFDFNKVKAAFSGFASIYSKEFFELTKRPLLKTHMREAPIRPDFVPGYRPAVLKLDNLNSRIAKCYHSYKTYDLRDTLFVLDDLDHYLGRYWGFMEKPLVPIDKILCCDPDKLDKDEHFYLTMSSSVSFPLCYKYSSIFEVLSTDDGVFQLKKLINGFVSGDFQFPFLTIPKDELRPVLSENYSPFDAYIDNIKLPRVISASPLPLTVLGVHLFYEQNERLMWDSHKGKCVIKIGVPVTHPAFVVQFCSLGNKCQDADGDGCDSNFFSSVSMIAALRARYLPVDVKQLVYDWYSAVYFGLVSLDYILYFLLCNKSGQYCTGIDNSLRYLAALRYAWRKCSSTYSNFPADDVFWLVLVIWLNGDDILLSWDESWFEKQDFVLDDCMDYLFLQMCNQGDPLTRGVRRLSKWSEVQFLSMSIGWVYIHFINQWVLIPAGNISKLVSSLFYYRKSKLVKNHIAWLQHLVGLRIFLYPFPGWFDWLESLIQSEIQPFRHDPRYESVFSQIIPESDLLYLYTGRRYV